MSNEANKVPGDVTQMVVAMVEESRAAHAASGKRIGWSGYDLFRSLRGHGIMCHHTGTTNGAGGTTGGRSHNKPVKLQMRHLECDLTHCRFYQGL